MYCNFSGFYCISPSSRAPTLSKNKPLAPCRFSNRAENRDFGASLAFIPYGVNDFKSSWGPSDLSTLENDQR